MLQNITLGNKNQLANIFISSMTAIERREEERDRLRREKLVARGVHHGRGGIHEKMLDQEVFMGRAELPVHGSRSQSRTRRGEGDEDEAWARTGERMMNGGSGGRTRATSNSIPMAM